MILAGAAVAQNNTNSPYTRYGYGDLSPQTFGKSKGMGGVAYGLRDGYQVNAVNPASYTMVDSLTFLFDAGFSIQNTNMSDGKTKMNAGNSSFDYATMQFRLHPRLGMTLGLLPYSNVGYSFTITDAEDLQKANYKTYSGEGGFHQAFLGIGVKILKNLSVGVNASYLWGDITRQDHLGFYAFQNYETWRINNLSVKDFKFDIGAQYTHTINKKNEVTLGAVYSPKKKLNSEAYLQTQSALSTGSSDSPYTDYRVTKTDIDAEYGLPMSVGVGVAYQYDKRLTLAADYTFQQWSGVKYQDEDAFYDMQKMAVGLEYQPNNYSRNYLARIKYRIGAYYSTPYYKVAKTENNQKKYYRASNEYGVTAGLGIPLPRVRSVLSISAQYVNVSGKQIMMDEKYMRLCIGMTFNEIWFFKRQVE